MDKLKTVLAAIKKHHFWVLSGVVIVVALLSWTWATTDLANGLDSRKTTLEGYFNDLRGIIEMPDHPNEDDIAEIKVTTEKLKSNVLDAWVRLYQDQKQKNKLPDSLSPQFQQVFESLGPEDKLPDDYLHEYWRFIPKHFSTLFEQIDLLRPETSDQDAAESDTTALARDFNPEPGSVNNLMSTTGGMSLVGPRETGKNDPNAKMIGTVEWDRTDREELVSQFTWPRLPTTEQVRLAQEDLWVYEALLRIIKNTNGGTTARHDAAVKRIEALQIAKEAAVSWLKARDSGIRFGVSAEETTKQPLSEPPPTTGGSFEENQSLLLNHFRYVDADDQPLPAPVQHPFAEYKIMPINMTLVVNQTAIPKLLAECANSNMPIRVRRVRLNPGQGRVFDLSRLAAGLPVEQPAAVSPQSRPTGEMFDPARATDLARRSPSDVAIEIQGVIYIYNPPDLAKLGTGGGGEEAAAATPPTPPAATPTTPPATPPTTPPAAPAPATPPAPAGPLPPNSG
jgi:hypothetical protein